VCIIALCIVVVGCITLSQSNGTLSENRQGNTNGNIHNDGTVIINGEWVYYTNFNENNRLYKMKLDGTCNKELVRGHYSYQLNFINGWIYYTSGIPGEVYKVNENGKKNKKIIDKKVSNLIVTSKNIFYIQSYDDDWGKLYRTDLEGKNEILLANNINEFAFCDGYIYFSNRDDESSLYKMDLDGGNVMKLNSEYSSNINVDSEYVYYTNYNDKQKLFRIKKDGTDKKLLSQDMCGEVNLIGEHIYYRNHTNKGQIYRMKKDGSENEVIIDRENCVCINLTDYFIIFRIPESTGGYFKANLDGSNLQKWANVP